MSAEKTAPKLREKGRIMSASEIERTLVRLAHEIIEKNNGAEDLGLVGIKRRGVPLAERLGALIGASKSSPSIPAYSTSASTVTTCPRTMCVRSSVRVRWAST